MFISENGIVVVLGDENQSVEGDIRVVSRPSLSSGARIPNPGQCLLQLESGSSSGDRVQISTPLQKPFPEPISWEISPSCERIHRYYLYIAAGQEVLCNRSSRDPEPPPRIEWNNGAQLKLAIGFVNCQVGNALEATCKHRRVRSWAEGLDSSKIETGGSIFRLDF